MKEEMHLAGGRLYRDERRESKSAQVADRGCTLMRERRNQRGPLMRCTEPPVNESGVGALKSFASIESVPVSDPTWRQPYRLPPVVHDVLRSPGEPLSLGSRSFMEPRFGKDFSQVRVHTDSRAAESAESIGARAFTVGQNVVFGAGEYAPQTSPGRMLLAHELTHVVQQGASTAMPNQISRAGEPAEQEARRTARAAVEGRESVPMPTQSASGVQREEMPELRLTPPKLEAPKPAGLSLFPPGKAPRLSLGFEEDLLRMRGLTGVKPRPNLFPKLSDQLEQPDPLERGLPAGVEGPAKPEKKEKLGDLWALSFDLDIDKSSALGQMLARQKKEKALLTALSGKTSEGTPLGLELLNTGINILGELPPLRGAREKLHSTLRVNNITIVADGENFGAMVEFKFGGRTR
jgi:hypothetical protein